MVMTCIYSSCVVSLDLPIFSGCYDFLKLILLEMSLLPKGENKKHETLKHENYQAQIGRMKISLSTGECCQLQYLCQAFINAKKSDLYACCRALNDGDVCMHACIRCEKIYQQLPVL